MLRNIQNSGDLYIDDVKKESPNLNYLSRRNAIYSIRMDFLVIQSAVSTMTG